jgi:hypothetical protein
MPLVQMKIKMSSICKKLETVTTEEPVSLYNRHMLSYSFLNFITRGLQIKEGKSSMLKGGSRSRQKAS